MPFGQSKKLLSKLEKVVTFLLLCLAAPRCEISNQFLKALINLKKLLSKLNNIDNFDYAWYLILEHDSEHK